MWQWSPWKGVGGLGVGLIWGAILSIGGCGDSQPKPDGPSASLENTELAQQADKSQEPQFTLTSRAFQHGQPIPTKYTGDGEDLSPPLTWNGVPKGTKEFALICDDPDAPRAEPWVHWVIYGITSDVRGLPEGLAKVERPQEPIGALQGKNSWPEGENIGYRGPAPPPGKAHRYYFRLYALDQAGPNTPGLTKDELLKHIQGHVLGEAVLMGTYQRKQ